MISTDPEKPIAIVLLNLGGPDSIKAIRPFLKNLFSDRSIIRLPMQPILSRLIARSRARKVAPRYKAIGGGSPILRITEEQGRLMEAALRRAGLKARVYVGMSYWHPYISDTVARIIEDGFDQILAFSLYPHYSRATTGACVSQVKEAIANANAKVKVDTVEAWGDDPDYLDALAEQVKLGLAKFTAEQQQGLKVIFSAHSLPQDFVDAGDPYPEHLRKTIGGLIERLGPLDWVLAYQSRSGPVKWLEPQTDATIADLGRQGAKYMLVVPLSFVGDHIETLYEIDIMYKGLAQSCGVEVFERSPSLNSSGAFIKALVGIALKKLGQQIRR